MQIKETTARDALNQLRYLATMDPDRVIGFLQPITIKKAIQHLKQTDPDRQTAAVFLDPREGERPIIAAFSVTGGGVLLVSEFTEDDAKLMVDTYVNNEEDKNLGIMGND